MLELGIVLPQPDGAVVVTARARRLAEAVNDAVGRAERGRALRRACLRRRLRQAVSTWASLAVRHDSDTAGARRPEQPRRLGLGRFRRRGGRVRDRRRGVDDLHSGATAPPPGDRRFSAATRWIRLRSSVYDPGLPSPSWSWRRRQDLQTRCSAGKPCARRRADGPPSPRPAGRWPRGVHLHHSASRSMASARRSRRDHGSRERHRPWPSSAGPGRSRAVADLPPQCQRFGVAVDVAVGLPTQCISRRGSSEHQSPRFSSLAQGARDGLLESQLRAAPTSPNSDQREARPVAVWPRGTG